jgi:hypothetical protein
VGGAKTHSSSFITGAEALVKCGRRLKEAALVLSCAPQDQEKLGYK